MRGENKFLRIIQVGVLLFCISFDYWALQQLQISDRDFAQKLAREHSSPDPEIRGIPGLKKSFFRPIGLQFGLKIRGGGGRGGGRSLAPPLDPPLGFSFKIEFYFFWSCSGQFRSVSEILFFVFTVY